METTLILIANLLVSILSGVLTAGLVMVIGGVGVIRALHRRLVLAEDRIEDANDRITTEVKRRAAKAALAARDEAPPSPQDLAREHLAKGSSPAAQPGKPSIVGSLKA